MVQLQTDPMVFVRFGVAILIGILIGLQREYSFASGEDKEHTAGIRTFALLLSSATLNTSDNCKVE
jgi:uncharacterized membrane protein YhiD involved in acid resistance